VITPKSQPEKYLFYFIYSIDCSYLRTGKQSPFKNKGRLLCPNNCKLMLQREGNSGSKTNCLNSIYK